MFTKCQFKSKYLKNVFLKSQHLRNVNLKSQYFKNNLKSKLHENFSFKIKTCSD